MGKKNFIEKLAARFGQNASVRNVFGEPIKAGDKTIIPVAQVAYGFGGGFGHGKVKNLPGTKNEGNNPANNLAEGGGGGGGMMAKPKGVYEITPQGTRFIPANNYRPLIAGIVIGLFIRSFLKRIK